MLRYSSYEEIKKCLTNPDSSNAKKRKNEKKKEKNERKKRKDSMQGQFGNQWVYCGYLLAYKQINHSVSAAIIRREL